MSRFPVRLFGSALAATIALTALDVAPAAAASPQAPVGVTTFDAPTDISAARKRKRIYRRGGDAAAIAAFAGIVGSIAAIAAAERRRKYYDGYYVAPGYYPPAYGYGYYGPRHPYGYHRGYRGYRGAYGHLPFAPGHFGGKW